jgi:hypothetical protein
MTVNPVLAQPMMCDELHGVVSMLCVRFPERDPVEVERLVTDVFQVLSEDARIRAHLIPLTLNRCRRTLSGRQTSWPEDNDGRTVCSQTASANPRQSRKWSE